MEDPGAIGVEGSFAACVEPQALVVAAPTRVVDHAAGREGDEIIVAALLETAASSSVGWTDIFEEGAYL